MRLDNVHEPGVWHIGQCGFPVVMREAGQVERARRKTSSRARSALVQRRSAIGDLRASMGSTHAGDRDGRGYE
jgi:hypothetical protein